MSTRTQKKDSVVFSLSKNQTIALGVAAAIVLILALTMFISGSKSAAKKYEETIAQMQAELDELADPIAVYESITPEIDLAVINSQIEEIGELATLEYLYTDAAKFEDPKKVFGKSVPFTTKSFIAKWDGSIKLGIDVTQIKTELDKANKTLIISLPESKILSHEIDSSSVETLDQKDGLFNRVKVEDVRAFDAASKESMEQRVIEMGLLEKADENARNLIRNLVDNDVLRRAGYSIIFR